MQRHFPLTPAAKAAMALAAMAAFSGTFAVTPLDDAPPLSSVEVPKNLALALSVEFPTAISVAHITDKYTPNEKFIGYFDHKKCYSYKLDGADPETKSYFIPVSATSSDVLFTCTGAWSGNFLNWITMQTIDPFRWKLTGGDRFIDTETVTVLQKAKSNFQGGDTNFPLRALTDGGIIAGATPFPATTKRLDVSTRTRGFRFHFMVDSPATPPPFTGTATHYDGARTLTAAREYSAFGRVQVCVVAPGVTLEENCVRYARAHKPEGLMQKYANKLRYSVFGYPVDAPVNLLKDGGVLRARQKFIGPTEPVPNAASKLNTSAEWNAVTGQLIENPDRNDADATNVEYGTSIKNSGAINYLNKFGSLREDSLYKTFDPVGELYYTATRYFKNLGPVPEYSARGTTPADVFVDGFPIINKWDDPIRYRCQQNTIVGIGDTNTHADRNLPGASGRSEPTKPAAVTADTTVNVFDYTNRVGVMSGITGLGALQPLPWCCNNNGALMAGLAYHSNVNDIRPDTDPRMLGKQTIQTYWMDVLEGRVFRANNQYYLAAKYGGFAVPDGYDDTRTTDIPEGTWYTTTEKTLNGDKKPDNYFVASSAQQMADGLEAIFEKNGTPPPSYSSSFATSQPQLVSTGAASFGSRYDPGTWSSTLNASALTFDPSTGAPKPTLAWEFSAKLTAQAASAGIDVSRRIVTYREDTKKGVPFTVGTLSTAQLSALDTAFVPSDDRVDYLNYLRGDRKNEVSSTGGTKAYRDRASLVSDIVNFKIRTVAPPSAPLSDTYNPGYSAFRKDYASRPTVIYAGTNGGMIHAVNASLTGPNAGQEIFAFMPNAVFQGPSGTPATNGIQALGKPAFKHYNRVDGRAKVADVYLPASGTRSAGWRTILVGGYGKGSKSLYALDITDPDNKISGKPLTETTVAEKVMWEFSHPKLGHIFSEPSVFKTARYGWVVLVGSGYNNVDGKGYFFLINPANGELFQEPIPTDPAVGTLAAEAGLAAVSAFVNDLSDGVADAAYAGDLLGNLWRLDMTSTTGDYPAAVKIAELKDDVNAPLPVTVSPFPAEEPGTQRRWITVGTGRLLANSDVANPQANRFFAIGDGFNRAFNKEANLPAGMKFPLQVSDFIEIKDLNIENRVDFKTKIGWFIDLGRTRTGGPGWRVVGESDIFFGRVAFPAVAPTSDDVCAPSGTSRIYAVALGAGKSTLLPLGSAYAEFAGLSTELITTSVGGKSVLLGGSDLTGEPQKFDEASSSSVQIKRINWREIKGTSGQ